MLTSKILKLYNIIKLKKIDLVVVGPEEPLVNGLVDFLSKKKIKVFGPNKFASKLEGSKAFMKKLCKENNIPTANFKVCKNKKQVINFINNNKLPLVVKADGLAVGKGVTICNTRKVINISEEIFKESLNPQKIVLESIWKEKRPAFF